MIRIHDLQPDTPCKIFGTFTNDRNFHDSDFISHIVFIKKDSSRAEQPPIGSITWTTDDETVATYDISWYNETGTEFVIDIADELAGVATYPFGGCSRRQCLVYFRHYGCRKGGYSERYHNVEKRITWISSKLDKKTVGDYNRYQHFAKYWAEGGRKWSC